MLIEHYAVTFPLLMPHEPLRKPHAMLPSFCSKLYCTVAPTATSRKSGASITPVPCYEEHAQIATAGGRAASLPLPPPLWDSINPGRHFVRYLAAIGLASSSGSMPVSHWVQAPNDSSRRLGRLTFNPYVLDTVQCHISYRRLHHHQV